MSVIRENNYLVPFSSNLTADLMEQKIKGISKYVNYGCGKNRVI